MARQVGVKKLVVFVNKVDAVEDKEMLELVEMEMRELLNTYGFEGDETPIVLGSALCALDGKQPEIGVQKIDELLNAIDEWIPTPQRNTDQPFLMAVEDVFSIPGRGVSPNLYAMIRTLRLTELDCSERQGRAWPVEERC